MKAALLSYVRGFGPWLVPIFLAVLFFYYIVLGLGLYQRVDDDPNFSVREVTLNGSFAVDIAGALIDREINTHEWMSNEPWFMPGSWLTRTPSYQAGIVMGLRRFVMAMIDHLARQRGSSQIDSDLQAAQASLNFHMDRWVPTPADMISPSTEKEYKNAIKALRAFNKRYADGSALYEKRADNLQATLDSIAADLGSQSAAVADHIRQYGGEILEFRSNALYFSNKGRLYAYYLLMRELGKDFADVIKEKGLGSVWDNTISSLRDAASLHPLIVFNGKGDSQFIPCHLCSQGFELLRARTQIREVTSILVK
jgi:hypothetical protein